MIFYFTKEASVAIGKTKTPILICLGEMMSNTSFTPTAVVMYESNTMGWKRKSIHGQVKSMEPTRTASCGNFSPTSQTEWKSVQDLPYAELADGLNITNSTFTTISSSESLRNGGDCVFNSKTTEKVPVPNPSISQGWST